MAENQGKAYDVAMKPRNQRLDYGDGRTLELTISAGTSYVELGPDLAESVVDLAGALREASQHPLGFPPLARSVVDGDQVAIAVEADVPGVETLVQSLLQLLVDAGIRPADVCVVCAEEELPERLQESAGEGTEVIWHDPRDREQHTYLAASRSARPIYLQRRLLDADVVIPMGAVRLPDMPGQAGVVGALFPTFSDEATQRRFYSSRSVSRPVNRRRLEAVEEALWLSGTQFTVQVVPGARGGVGRVLMGALRDVSDEGRKVCEQAWRFDVPESSAVVATLTGPPRRHTWGNLARALYSASRVVRDEGDVLLCTELATPPGPAVQAVAQAIALGEPVDEQLRRTLDALTQRANARQAADARSTDSPGDSALPDEPDESVDTSALGSDGELAGTAGAKGQAAWVLDDLLAACVLRDVAPRCNIFLMSRLPDDEVEELGIGPVNTAEEASRLVSHHTSVVVLHDADRGLVGAPPVAQRAE